MWDCPICKELQAKPTSRLAQLLQDQGIRNSIIYETKNLVVIPSIGPLCYGHVLIVTKSHSSNVLVEALQGSYLSEVKDCISLLQNQFGKDKSLFISEHGKTVSEANASLCSTEHGHLHVLPVNSEVSQTIIDDFNGKLILGNLEDISNNLSSFKEYVTLILHSNFKEFVAKKIVVESQIVSQMTRMHIAKYIGCEHWDWKIHQNRKVLMDIILSSGEINRTISIANS